jgi:hypothetical protein
MPAAQGRRWHLKVSGTAASMEVFLLLFLRKKEALALPMS